MKKKFVVFHLDFCEVIECQLWFCLGNDVQAAIKLAKKRGYNLTDETFGGKRGMFIQSGEFPPMIFCSQVPFDTTFHSTVLHELYHFVDWACKYWNIPHTPDTDEVRAQLYSHAARRYFENVLRLR